MNYWNSFWIQPYFFHFNLTTHCAHYVLIIRWKTISLLELRKISTWYLWPCFNNVGTPYKRPMSLWRKKKEKTKCYNCFETRARSEGYMVKIFKTQCPKPWLVGSHTSMLVTRVNRWSLTYCKCLGIKFQFQKSGVKSEELVVERFLNLDALNLDWLGVIDGSPLHGHFRKQYL